MKVKPNKIQGYIYMFLLLALSGNPFFNIGDESSQYIFAGFVLLLALKHYNFLNIKRGKLFFFFISFFTLIFLFQHMMLGFISIPGAIGFLLKITVGYILVRAIGEKFRLVYLKIIYFISLISLFGFTFINLGSELPNFLNNPGGDVRSVILFTQNVGGVNSLRNSGMFWEPGAFACYICLGFLFYLGNTKELWKNHRFKVLVIVMALITTFSTTGYIVFFMIGLATVFLEYSKKYGILATPLVLAVLSIGYFTYERSDFLKEKIEHQFSNTLNKDSNEFSPDRFGAFLFDLNYIKKHPLIGNGLHESTRFADHPWLQNEKLGHGNGFSNFLASMGILSFLVFIYFILKYNQNHPLVFLVAILALLQGEQLMNFPLFLSLPFIFAYDQHNSRTSNLSQQEDEDFALSPKTF